LPRRAASPPGRLPASGGRGEGAAGRSADAPAVGVEAAAAEEGVRVHLPPAVEGAALAFEHLEVEVGRGGARVPRAPDVPERVALVDRRPAGDAGGVAVEVGVVEAVAAVGAGEVEHL